MDYLNLGKGTFSDWKAGKSTSYRRYLIEIAEFFNTSIDYLVYGTAPEKELTQNETELLELFRSFPEREQIKLLGKIETLLEESRRTEIVGLKIARRTDGEAVRTGVTAEELEEITQLPEETDF